MAKKFINPWGPGGSRWAPKWMADSALESSSVSILQEPFIKTYTVIWESGRTSISQILNPDQLEKAVNAIQQGGELEGIVAGSSIFNAIVESKINQLPTVEERVEAFNRTNQLAAEEAFQRARNVFVHLIGTTPASDSTRIRPNANQAAITDYSGMLDPSEKPFIQGENSAKITIVGP